MSPHGMFSKAKILQLLISTQRVAVDKADMSQDSLIYFAPRTLPGLFFLQHIVPNGTAVVLIFYMDLEFQRGC